MAERLSISDATWRSLTDANSASWARYGVFATAIGPEYFASKRCRLLYVGKSPGPKGGEVGSNHDQRESGQKSLEWMINRKNPSLFWSFIDEIAPRECIAWTNVCKVDQKNDKEPTVKQWGEIADASFSALEQEINYLEPQVALFVTKNQSFCRKPNFEVLLTRLGYNQISDLPIDSRWAICRRTSTGKVAISTPHPQAYPADWPCSERNRLAELVKTLLDKP